MFKYIILFVCVFIAPLLKAQESKLLIPTGHKKGITTIDISTDSRYALSGAVDGLMKLWDINKGIEIKTFVAHTEKISSVCFSPNDKYALSASADKTLKLWNIADKKLLKTFLGHTGTLGVTVACFSPDGKFVLSAGSEPYHIKLWDINKGKVIKLFKGHEVNIFSLAYSSDGQYILSAGGTPTKGFIFLWDVRTAKLIKTFRGHSSTVNSATFSANDKYIVSGSIDNKVKIWSAKKSFSNRKITGHSARINSTFYSKNGKYILSASGGLSHDNSVRLWSEKTDKQLRIFNSHKHNVTVAQFFNDDSNIISASIDNSIKIWDVRSGMEIKTMQGHCPQINDIKYSKQSQCIASAYSDNNIRLWNIGKGNEVKVLRGHNKKVNSLSISKDGWRALSASDDRMLKLWNLRTGREISTLRGHFFPVKVVEFSPDGRYAISASDKSIKLWDTKVGVFRKTLADSIPPIKDLIFLTDSTHAISAHKGEINNLLLWNIKLFTNDTLKIYPDQITALSLSNDGKIALTAYADSTLILWKPITGEKIKIFKDSTIAVSAIFSQDNKSVLTAMIDNTIMLRNINSEKILWQSQHHTAKINSIVFTDDGLFIISASDDATIQILDAKTGNLILRCIAYDIYNWLVIMPSGLYDGTYQAIKNIFYKNQDNYNPLKSVFIDYFTPGLLAINDNIKNLTTTKNINESFDLPPKVKIISPVVNKSKRLSRKVYKPTSNSEKTSISINVTDSGTGIDEVCLYHNGKLSKSTGAKLTPVKSKGNLTEVKFEVILSPGKNTFTASAYNHSRIEATSDKITIFYRDKEQKPDLYVVSVGVGSYKNDYYDINYSSGDAHSFSDVIRTGFKNYDEYFSYTFVDDTATKSEIKNTFDEISNIIKPNDLFVFYFAGHGLTVKNTSNLSSDYYLITHDLTDIKEKNKLLRQAAINTNELSDWMKNISACKCLVIIDAAQAPNTKAMKPNDISALDKTLFQFAKRTGIAFIANTNSEQNVKEYPYLNHGLLFYAIKETLYGKINIGETTKQQTIDNILLNIQNNYSIISKRFYQNKRQPLSFTGEQKFIVISK